MDRLSSGRGPVLYTLEISIFFLFISLSCYGLATAKSKSVPNHSSGMRTLNSKPIIVSLADFGAVGDGSVDDAPALQKALDALAESGGGTLQVPAGNYLLRTPVSKQFTSGLDLSIEGAPSTTPIDVAGNGNGLDLSSVFIIAAGDANTAIGLNGLDSLRIADVAFNGVKETITDARIVLGLTKISSATIYHCEFYGLASLVAGGAIIAADRADLRLQQTAFLGCAANSGRFTSVVQATSWLGVFVTDCKFVDYGLKPDFFSKTPLAAPYSWIMLGNAAEPEPKSSRREAVLNNVFLDEGAFTAVAALPERFGGKPPHIFEVYLAKLYVNVTNLGASGIYVSGARKVFIQRSHLGWSHRADKGIYLTNVGEAVLDLVDCSDDATRIFASAERLTVINSVYTSLESTGLYTRKYTTNQPSEDPAQYITAQYLSKVNRDPDAAGHFYWTNRFLHCETDQSCVAAVRSALEDYLTTQPSERFSLKGKVVDENGSPVGAAGVKLTNSHSVVTTTDANGNFAFDDLPTAGEYQIVATKNHYLFQNQNLVTPASDHPVTITGTLLRHSIFGHVIDSRGNGVASATLRLAGPEALTTVTDDKGYYEFRSLRAGYDYILSVSRKNYRFSESIFTFRDLSADQNQVIAAEVVKYSIEGTVLKVNGMALKDAVVTLSGGSGATAYTDQNGKYSFSVEAEKDYVITPQKINYVFEPLSLNVNALSGNQIRDFTVKPRPVLLSMNDSTRALAIDAILRTVEPFHLSYDYAWGIDSRTRLILYVVNVELNSGETLGNLTAEIEDARHSIYPLTVEYVGKVDEAPTVTRIVVRLSDQLTEGGDVRVRIKSQNISSEPLLLAIGHFSN